MYNGTMRTNREKVKVFRGVNMFFSIPMGLQRVVVTTCRTYDLIKLVRGFGRKITTSRFQVRTWDPSKRGPRYKKGRLVNLSTVTEFTSE